MKLSLEGYVRGARNDLRDIEDEIKDVQKEYGSSILEDANIDSAVMCIETLRDLILALLKGDIEKQEAIDFLALGDLAELKYFDALVKIQPKTEATNEQ